VQGDAAGGRGCGPRSAGITDARRTGMLDLVFVIVTIAFFALGVAYTRACDHL
jgi:hypothetical protein